MGSIDRRIQGLEKQLISQGKACSECGGRIPIIERHDDGEVSYPFGEPCDSCDGGSGVRFIEIVLGGDDGS